MWFINLGYTLELVPLCVKVAALNLLMKSAIKMRRLKLNRNRLFGIVFLFAFSMIIFLLCWTTLDPPHKEAAYRLTESTTPTGETVVNVHYECHYGGAAWRYTAFGVFFFYLVVATVQAIKTYNLRQAFNESQTLAIMIYSHAMFGGLQVVSIVLVNNESMQISSGAWFRSIVLSCDVIATVCIYFVPKLVVTDKIFLEDSIRPSGNYNSYAVNTGSSPPPPLSAAKNDEDQDLSDSSDWGVEDIDHQSARSGMSGLSSRPISSLPNSSWFGLIDMSSGDLQRPEDAIRSCPTCGQIAPRPPETNGILTNSSARLDTFQVASTQDSSLRRRVSQRTADESMHLSDNFTAPYGRFLPKEESRQSVAPIRECEDSDESSPTPLNVVDC